MARVVVTDATFPALEHEREAAEKSGATFELLRDTSEANLVAAARDANVLVVQFAAVGRRVIDALAPNATVIRYGVGLDNIDLYAANERGVQVAYIPDYAVGEVADHTAGLILTLLRKIIPLDRSVRARQWDAVGVSKPLKAFSNSVIGFIGFGRIGQEVYTRLKPFGFQAVAHDPAADPQTLLSLGVDSVGLDKLFSFSDVVTLHAPLTEDTRCIVNSERLKQMRSTAVLVNTARGELVASEQLADALLTGEIAGAALDVFEQEPIPDGSALLKCPNLILTPHAAWYSDRAIETLQVLAADEITRALSGRPPRCPAPLQA